MVSDIHAIKKGNSAAPSVTNVNINGTEYYYDCDYLENSTYVSSDTTLYYVAMWLTFLPHI